MCRGDEIPLGGYCHVYMYKLIATTKFEKIAYSVGHSFHL